MPGCVLAVGTSSATMPRSFARLRPATAQRKGCVAPRWVNASTACRPVKPVAPRTITSSALEAMPIPSPAVFKRSLSPSGNPRCDALRRRLFLGPLRKSDDETAAAAIARFAAGVAAVALGDLLHKTETEPDTAGFLGVARQAIERLEDALALRCRHARPAIADTHHGVAADALHADADIVAAIALGVLEQVSQRPPQQSLISGHGQRRAVERGIHPCGLFGGEAEQVDFVALLELAQRIEAT